MYYKKDGNAIKIFRTSKKRDENGPSGLKMADLYHVGRFLFSGYYLLYYKFLIYLTV